MDLKILILTSLLCISAFRLLSAEEPSTEQVQEFLSVHLDYAKSQAIMSGIPVSFTLGQAMLESGYGKSELAVNANNFFGIKAQGGWDGSIYYMKSKEQSVLTGTLELQPSNFRQYADISSCYDDRLNFLWSSPRYINLFDLASNDYRGWAEGIHQAGYATDPNYSMNMVNFIEKHNLSQYDILLAKDEIFLNRILPTRNAKDVAFLIKAITPEMRAAYQKGNKQSVAILDAAEKMNEDIQLQINDLKRISVNMKAENLEEKQEIYAKIASLEAAIVKQEVYIKQLTDRVVVLEKQMQGVFASDPLLRNTETFTANSLFPIQKTSNDGTFYIAGKKVVQLRDGQTLLDIAYANDIEYKNLLNYNEVSVEVVELEKKLPDNLYIFLEPKANFNGDTELTHQVRQGENMYLISQLYGVKIQRLYARNLLNLQTGEEPMVGEFIFINKKSTNKPKTRPFTPADSPTSLFNAGGGYRAGR